MDIGLAHSQSQTLLKQRNVLAVAALALAGLLGVSLLYGASQEREVVLQPILSRPLVISSAGVSREYLEMVTRDTALIALNRSPENLQYWRESLLAIAAPQSRGALNRDLMRIVTEQQGSSVSQYFTMDSLKVDPEALTSEVSGTLHTVVGSKQVTSSPRTFRFDWHYSGLALKLRGFGMVTRDKVGASS